MKTVDNNMNIRPSRGDIEQSSQPGTRVADSTRANPATGTGTSPAKGDKVTFTGIATEMRTLEADLAKIPDVDLEHVGRIKAAIADGTYKVDAEKIVENLLDLERTLGQ